MPSPAENRTAYYRNTMDRPPPGRCDWFLKDIPQGGRVLDFAAGTGRFAAAFKRDRPDLEVDALEMHPEALSILRTREGLGHIYAQRFEQFAPRAPYDAIWAKDCLFFAKNEPLAATLRRLCDALTSGGRFYATFVKEDEKENPFPGDFLRYSEEDILSRFEACGFTLDSVKEYEGRFGPQMKLAGCLSVYALRQPFTDSA